MAKDKDSESKSSKDPWVILILIFLASIVVVGVHAYIVSLVTAKDELGLLGSQVAVSNLYRNYGLTFLGIFGGGLAIWARFAHQTQLQYAREQLEHTQEQIKNAEEQIANGKEQLKHTQEQIENSLAINRNDRFAKAVEMLEGDKSSYSHSSALYMLRDLVGESPETEHIRCVEAITDWLREKARPLEFIQIAVSAFRYEKSEKLLKNIEKHKEEHNISLWPNLSKAILHKANLKKANLKGANLQSADLQIANLEGANLQGANLQSVNFGEANLKNANLEYTNLKDVGLKGAFVAGTKMKDTKMYIKNELLKATCKGQGGNKKHPELPADLKNHPDVVNWRDNPPFNYKLYQPH